MDTTFIYALCEPGTRTVRYIGKTKNLKRRFRQHTCKSNRTNHRTCWLYSLLSKGLNPEMIVLSEVPTLTWKEEEMRYIRAARVLGMNLVNGNDGGEGSIECSPETRRKMSECKLGSKNPMFGKPGSNLGAKFSPQHCAALSAARTGVPKGPYSPEHCAAISASLKGVPKEPHSPETRAAISASLKGVPWSPERRAAHEARKAAK